MAMDLLSANPQCFYIFVLTKIHQSSLYLPIVVFNLTHNTTTDHSKTKSIIKKKIKDLFIVRATKSAFEQFVTVLVVPGW